MTNTAPRSTSPRQLSPSLVFTVPDFESPEPSPDPLEPLDRSQVMAAIGITAFVLLLITKAWQAWGQVYPLGIRWTVWELGAGLGLGLAITVASGGLYALWPQYRASTTLYLDLVVKPLAWIDLVWLGLLPGLSEELLFRGMVLSAFGLGWGVLLLSSFCFGLLHLSSWQQWPYGVWASVVGLILALSVVWTGHLLVAVVAHMVTNMLWGGLWKWRYQQDL